jgi:hypothetical protein
MKTIVEKLPATGPVSRTAAWNNEPATIVCLGLALAVLVLAFRIASVL